MNSSSCGKFQQFTGHSFCYLSKSYNYAIKQHMFRFKVIEVHLHHRESFIKLGKELLSCEACFC